MERSTASHPTVMKTEVKELLRETIPRKRAVSPLSCQVCLILGERGREGGGSSPAQCE